MMPEAKEFREIVKKCRGNLSRVADACGVSRVTVGKWMNSSEEYKEIVHDARMRLFDDCLTTSEVVAFGIPVRDENNRIIGWEEKPDGNMLRYLMGKLGVSEGFGDNQSQDLTIETGIAEAKKGISINVVYNDKKDLELQGKRKEDVEE